MASASVVERLIRRYGLQPHPEGGYYAETYRSPQRVQHATGGDDRSASTAIYYLLDQTAYSAWHRIASDEMWHFYMGSPLDIHVLQAGGAVETQRLGNPLESEGASFQVLVPAGCWFGAERPDPEGYTLAGCTVAPGFEFSEFELADCGDLLRAYPGHEALIRRLARGKQGSDPVGGPTP
ncbi:cupin domain-containing protein [Alcaligenaceae bacterium]|nr:cupin domain-containing protein [Alcaligenaceae bacterium]